MTNDVNKDTPSVPIVRVTMEGVPGERAGGCSSPQQIAKAIAMVTSSKPASAATPSSQSPTNSEKK